MFNSLDTKIVNRKFTDYKLGWLFIFLRSIFIISAFCFNLFVRKALCPCVPFPQVKRYIESITNLLCMRITLVLLGFMNFQSESLSFFSKPPHKIILRSGYIGIGTHKNIVDYLYYSYLFNPVFVRLVIYKKGEKEQIFYSPLSFIEGLKAALDARGFDPIIVHNQKEYKNVKYRKLAMKTLVSECFEQLNGPIFILLPSIFSKTQLRLNKNIALDIYQNQIRFERSLVGLFVEVDQRIHLKQIHKNQVFFILDLLSQFKWLKMKVQAIQYRKFKHKYDRVTYSSFVDKFYEDNSYKSQEIDYESYIKQLDFFFRGEVKSKEQ